MNSNAKNLTQSIGENSGDLAGQDNIVSFMKESVRLTYPIHVQLVKYMETYLATLEWLLFAEIFSL